MTKETVRADALEKLRKATAQGKTARDLQTNHHLIELLKALEPDRVLAYVPLGFEADIRPTIHWLKARKKVFVPFMQGVSFKMVPYRLPLKHQALGIFTPADSGQRTAKVDVMIVPALAIDGAFARIGFGKGMYDRFYAELSYKPIVIFVQPFPIVTSAIVSAAHDMAGDFLVSARGVLRNQRGTPYDSRNFSHRSRHC
jgi:5-formyltetrahydrofolate cyclo-ligase